MIAIAVGILFGVVTGAVMKHLGARLWQMLLVVCLGVAYACVMKWGM